MTNHLLDTNVLLALSWPNHQFHLAAVEWFSKLQKSHWSTCSLTELGFVRLSSNPAFTRYAVAPSEAVTLLDEMKKRGHHRFISDCPTVRVSDFARAIGHQQVTDAYLLQLARRHRAIFVSFDARLQAQVDAAHVVVLATTR